MFFRIKTNILYMYAMPLLIIIIIITFIIIIYYYYALKRSIKTLNMSEIIHFPLLPVPYSLDKAASVGMMN